MAGGLVTIGMPVYNGGEELRRAIENLLAQTATNFEILISDNASTDGITPQIIEEFARRDSRIRYTRQPENRGAIANFLWVVAEARGEYFMWAAHDDVWSNNYVETLARCLDNSPDAVLATPATTITKTTHGSTVSRIMPPAPNADRWQTLEVFIKEAGCEWIYGLYRTEWLKSATPQWTGFPLLFGDLVWMFDLLVQKQVVGDAAAQFFYTNSHKTQKNKSRRLDKIEVWAKLIYHLFRICYTRVPRAERAQAISCACRLIYRFHIRRRGPLGTSINIVKLAALWSWFGLEKGASRMFGSRLAAR